MTPTALQPLICPMGILSPRGEGKVSNEPSRDKGNFLLAPWGEDARRAGEGL